MKVGDYIRTDNGYICKVLEYTDISDNDFYVNTDSPYNVIYKSWIIKSSPNIIDLIQVGDYVNGWRVNRVEKQEDGIFFTIGNITSFISKNETDPYLTRYHNGKNRMCKIESIVTKEQFEEMQYVVKED